MVPYYHIQILFLLLRLHVHHWTNDTPSLFLMPLEGGLSSFTCKNLKEVDLMDSVSHQSVLAPFSMKLPFLTFIKSYPETIHSCNLLQSWVGQYIENANHEYVYIEQS